VETILTLTSTYLTHDDATAPNTSLLLVYLQICMKQIRKINSAFHPSGVSKSSTTGLPG